MRTSILRFREPVHVAVGATDTNADMVEVIDKRAIGLNDKLDRFIGDKYKLLSSAPPDTQAFVEEFKEWYDKWQAWRLTFDALPFEAARETASVRKDAEAFQRDVRAWSPRIEALIAGKPVSGISERSSGTPSGLLVLGVVAALAVGGYAVWKWVL